MKAEGREFRRVDRHDQHLLLAGRDDGISLRQPRKLCLTEQIGLGSDEVHCFSPLRTDSRQLVSKIWWRRTTSGAIIGAPEWRKPTGFVCFAPALREHPGGCGSADHPKLPVQPRL